MAASVLATGSCSGLGPGVVDAIAAKAAAAISKFSGALMHSFTIFRSLSKITCHVT